MSNLILTGDIRILDFDDCEIPQHVETNYINATKLCQTRGKVYSNWRSLKSSQDTIDKVVRLTNKTESELIISVTNGPITRRATWVHFSIAAAIAAWVDPLFVIHCAMAMTRESHPQQKSHNNNTEPVDWDHKIEIANKLETSMRRMNNGQLERSDEAYFLAALRNIMFNILPCDQE